jgi:exodeoxyribonuclease-5
MALTHEQKDIIRSVISNIDNHQIQTVGGYAGTGKSTIITVLLSALDGRKLNFAPCAFTGKATNVLRRKGMSSARTIHSYIYKPVRQSDDSVVWIKKTRDQIREESIDGFIVDEASMISKEIYDDLCSFNLPLIFVGDHGQLEPIGTNFNLMSKPMYKLETVHRNAGEIAHFAEHLRKGNCPWEFNGLKKVQVVKDNLIEDRHLASVDQIICAFNKTRVSLNQRVRVEKNIQYTYVVVGEKIICLRNHREDSLFNGMQGVVTKINKGNRFDFTTDDTNRYDIRYDPNQFGKETNEFKFNQEEHPFDYAYAITCHKAQGDEWGNVIVYEQKNDKWDSARWNYTAASRAKNGLIWIGVQTYRPYYLS